MNQNEIYYENRVFSDVILQQSFQSKMIDYIIVKQSSAIVSTLANLDITPILRHGKQGNSLVSQQDNGKKDLSRKQNELDHTSPFQIFSGMMDLLVHDLVGTDIGSSNNSTWIQSTGSILYSTGGRKNRVQNAHLDSDPHGGECISCLFYLYDNSYLHGIVHNEPTKLIMMKGDVLLFWSRSFVHWGASYRSVNCRLFWYFDADKNGRRINQSYYNDLCDELNQQTEGKERKLDLMRPSYSKSCTGAFNATHFSLSSKSYQARKAAIASKRRESMNKALQVKKALLQLPKDYDNQSKSI